MAIRQIFGPDSDYKNGGFPRIPDSNNILKGFFSKIKKIKCLVFFRESNQILRYYLYIMMIIFAFKKVELKVKTQYANFSLPIKNSNPLLKNGFRIPKSAKN